MSYKMLALRPDNPGSTYFAEPRISDNLRFDVALKLGPNVLLRICQDIPDFRRVLVNSQDFMIAYLKPYVNVTDDVIDVWSFVFKITDKTKVLKECFLKILKKIVKLLAEIGEYNNDDDNHLYDTKSEWLNNVYQDKLQIIIKYALNVSLLDIVEGRLFPELYQTANDSDYQDYELFNVNYFLTTSLEIFNFFLARQELEINNLINLWFVGLRETIYQRIMQLQPKRKIVELLTNFRAFQNYDIDHFRVDTDYRFYHINIFSFAKHVGREEYLANYHLDVSINRRPDPTFTSWKDWYDEYFEYFSDWIAIVPMLVRKKHFEVFRYLMQRILYDRSYLDDDEHLTNTEFLYLFRALDHDNEVYYLIPYLDTKEGLNFLFETQLSTRIIILYKYICQKLSYDAVINIALRAMVSGYQVTALELLKVTYNQDYFKLLDFWKLLAKTFEADTPENMGRIARNHTLAVYYMEYLKYYFDHPEELAYISEFTYGSLQEIIPKYNPDYDPEFREDNIPTYDPDITQKLLLPVKDSVQVLLFPVHTILEVYSYNSLGAIDKSYNVYVDYTIAPGTQVWLEIRPGQQDYFKQMFLTDLGQVKYQLLKGNSLFKKRKTFEQVLNKTRK